MTTLWEVAVATVRRYIERPAAMRTDLDEWMKQQGDHQTVFGNPLRLGEPVTLLTPGGAGKKKASAKDATDNKE